MSLIEQARDTMVALGEFFFAETHMEIGVSMLKRASWNGLLSNPKGPLDTVIWGPLMRGSQAPWRGTCKGVSAFTICFGR